MSIFYEIEFAKYILPYHPAFALLPTVLESALTSPAVVEMLFSAAILSACLITLA